MEMSVYIGPYIRMVNSVIRVDQVPSSPYLGCTEHPEMQFTSQQFCPKCGTKLERISPLRDKIVRVSNILAEKFESDDYNFFDKYCDIQGFVEQYDNGKCIFILNRGQHTYGVETYRGANSIFNLDIDLIKSMQDPENEKYADYHRLINVLNEMGVAYTTHLGYITYWS